MMADLQSYWGGSTGIATVAKLFFSPREAGGGNGCRQVSQGVQTRGDTTDRTTVYNETTGKTEAIATRRSSGRAEELGTILPDDSAPPARSWRMANGTA